MREQPTLDITVKIKHDGEMRITCSRVETHGDVVSRTYCHINYHKVETYHNDMSTAAEELWKRLLYTFMTASYNHLIVEQVNSIVRMWNRQNINDIAGKRNYISKLSLPIPREYQVVWEPDNNNHNKE